MGPLLSLALLFLACFTVNGRELQEEVTVDDVVDDVVGIVRNKLENAVTDSEDCPSGLVVLGTCISTNGLLTEEEASRVRSEVNSFLDTVLGSAGEIGTYFKAWQAQYDTFFEDGSQDYNDRLNIFEQNLAEIKQGNEQAAGSYLLAPNCFSHMTSEEFLSTRLGLVVPDSDLPQSAPPNELRRRLQGGSNGSGRALLQGLPTSVDWEQQGKVTDVKNQWQCGSCWAFSATAALESRFLIAGGQEVWDLSEQQLVDCVTPANGFSVSKGCGGGSPYEAFTYMSQVYPNTEANYGYRVEQQACNTDLPTVESPFVSSDTPYIRLKDYSAADLMAALVEGPVVIGMYAEPMFQNYKEGIYWSDQCNYQINHAMLAVGYYMDADGPGGAGSYFRIKNSWGTHWGENGYVKMWMADEGTYGTCSMYTYSYAPGPIGGVPNSAPSDDSAAPPADDSGSDYGGSSDGGDYSGGDYSYGGSPGQRSCSIERGTDFYGCDLQDNPTVQASSVEACCGLCWDREECYSFTFNSATGECFLKYGRDSCMPTWNADEGAVSGEVIL